MAIDFKGGFTDKRLEPWLYKFNYSEAQQWEFLEDNSKRVFRIQNPYNKKCFSVENNKVKLTLLDDNNQKQLWKFDKENKLMHVISGKYLDMDQNKDLIISKQSNHTWSMEDGGFIVNSKNMAIDIKGGINDKRNEIWLYKLNYSEAQQWELKDSNNLNILKVNTVTFNYDNIFPITTSIPSEIFVKDIDEVIKNKTKDMYDGIKNRPIGGKVWSKEKNRYVDGYEFSREEDYYNAYQEAKWGYTKKKNGWDCMRHYEIVANGCLPLFENLEGSPKLTMSSFPKNLLIEAKNKKDTMTEQEYNFYLKKIFNYFKENLTCKKVAEKFLQQIHKNKNKKISEVKILLLHGNEANNYMADMLFVGLRRILKENIVDEKKPIWVYKSYTGGSYGKGFTYTKRLDDMDIDRNNIEDKIKNKFFDYIIYRKSGGDEGELGDCRKKMEHWDLVEKTYNSNEIVFLYGGDRMVNDKHNNHLTNHLKYHSNKGLCFVREFTAPDILKYKNFINTKDIVNQYFDQIYIVHLDNFTDRKKKMIEQIKKFNLKNITVIDSINKEHIDMEKCKKLNIVAYPGIESCKHDPQCSCGGRGHKTHEFPGRVACYYGHYLAWEDIVKNKYKKCLILEDDFVLNNDFHNKFKTLYTHMPNDWEVILFENSQWINRMKHRYKNIHKKDIIDNDPYFFKTPYGTQDAGCYAITGNTAKVLVNKSLPIRAGADAFIGMCMDRYFIIKNFYISKINLSHNGSIGTNAGIYKGYTENTHRISDKKCDNNALNLELKKLVNKYEKTDINSLYLLEKPKTVLILNHNYHHKNKKGLEMICEYLDYNLIYGSEKDIPKADVIYCPSRSFNASKYPNKRFVFGPHLSIFPNGLLNNIHNKDNSVYIQPSPWARDVWTNWKDMDAEKLIPIKSFPFPVEVDLFKPGEHQIKENVFVMFKHRKPEELRFVENFLNNKKISYKTFRYGSYKQDDYIKHLKTCKYGIWIGRHESQGFALHESLSCNVPLLVWNVTNMRQQHGWNGCPDVYGITIPYWSKTCGEYFYKQDEFEKKYNIFLQNLNNYKPRDFIKNRVSVKQCAENFKNIFLNKKREDDTDYKLLTCANKNYFHALKHFINNVKQINMDFDKLIVYDVGLTNDQENELYILQAEYGFNIYKLDFSKYPEHVNLNLEKWSGLNNSYAFKAIVNYNVLQTIDCPLIFLDCGCHFSKESLLNIVKNTKEKGFWVNVSNRKNSIESLELNHPDTLKFFNIKNTEITTCLSGLLGIDYKNSYAKNIVDEWYKYSINQKVIIPDGANRNNHRNDQTVLSCILHNNNYNYHYKYTVDITPWRNKSTSPYYCKYKDFSCLKKQNNAYESLIYTNSLDEAIECYMGRKNISREILLKNFIISREILLKNFIIK